MSAPTTVLDAEAITREVLGEVAEERRRQDVKWGVQDHPNGVRPPLAHERRRQLQEECGQADEEGATTWRHILDEEWAEALDALDNPEALRKELVQVAAVSTAWIECIDRRIHAEVA